MMIHHAIELAKREPKVAAFSVNPGVAVDKYRPVLDRVKKACKTNLVGLKQCPEIFDNSAAVISAAAAWPHIESFAGSYLDFDTKSLPSTAPQVYGPWEQKDPSCMPREPPPMDAQLSKDWYDQMLKLMPTKLSEDTIFA